jgi:hypothetical protein
MQMTAEARKGPVHPPPRAQDSSIHTLDSTNFAASKLSFSIYQETRVDGDTSVEKQTLTPEQPLTMVFWKRLFTLQGEQFPNLLFHEMISSFPSVPPCMPRQMTKSNPFSGTQSNCLRSAQPIQFLFNISPCDHPLRHMT